MFYWYVKKLYRLLPNQCQRSTRQTNIGSNSRGRKRTIVGNGELTTMDYRVIEESNEGKKYIQALRYAFVLSPMGCIIITWRIIGGELPIPEPRNTYILVFA